MTAPPGRENRDALAAAALTAVLMGFRRKREDRPGFSHMRAGPAAPLCPQRHSRTFGCSVLCPGSLAGKEISLAAGGPF